MARNGHNERGKPQCVLQTPPLGLFKHLQLSPDKCSNTDSLQPSHWMCGGETAALMKSYCTQTHTEVQINTKQKYMGVLLERVSAVCSSVCAHKGPGVEVGGFYAEGKVVMRSCPSGGLIRARA